MHNLLQGIEFDPAKASSNLRKHGVSFAAAATSLLDPHALAMEDASEGEPRWLLVGCSQRGRPLTVSYALRDHVPRLISARKATAREKADYAK